MKKPLFCIDLTVQTCGSIIGFKQAIWSCKTKIISIKCGRCFCQIYEIVHEFGPQGDFDISLSLNPKLTHFVANYYIFPNCRNLVLQLWRWLQIEQDRELDDGHPYPMETPCCGCVNMSSPAPQKHVNSMQLHTQMN